MTRQSNAGRIAFGVVLIAIGIAWFLASTGAVDLDWALLLPAALVVVGLAVLATARTGGSGPLIAVGVVLTVLSVLATIAAPAFSPQVLDGGVGDRQVRPLRVDEDTDFELAVGALTVDLRETEDLPPEIEASVGMGELVVIVPDDVDVVLDASVGAGEIRAFGQRRDGTGVRLTDTFPAEGRRRGSVELDVSVTLGQIEVRR